ncbi:MAG: hypothetical protein Q8O46_02030 [bacterium]|nr:hypothetical protein [bacterium]
MATRIVFLNRLGDIGLFLTFLGSALLIYSAKYSSKISDDDVETSGALSVTTPSKEEKRKSKTAYNCGLWSLCIGFLFQFVERIVPLFIR